jgi:hypothetical protein
VEPAVPRKRRGPLFWVLLIGGILLVLCGGIAALLWSAVGDFVRIAQLPPAERQKAMSDKLRSMAPAETAAADSFLDDVEAGRLDAAWNATSPGFQASTTRKEFDELVETVRAVMGRSLSRDLVNMNARMVPGPGGTGYALTYAAKFEKGDGTVRVDLTGAAPAWTVQTWRTESPLFLEAAKKGAQAK